MSCTLWKSSILMACTVLYFSISVLAQLQNLTLDDHDYDRITYTTPADWSHDPLIGFEYLFYNGTRSYSYVPGASASFSFTGCGIYLQGPYANDQALRKVTLDGQDMGVFSAYAVNWTKAGVFWGKSGMKSTAHTVIVTHNDTTSKILVMDAWIVEFPSTSPFTSSVEFPSTSTPFPSSTSTRSTGVPRSLTRMSLLASIISVALLLLAIHGL